MKITILYQEYNCKPEDERKVVAILDAFNIKYIKDAPTKISEAGFSLRASNVLFQKFSGKHLNYDVATLDDLVKLFDKESLIRAKGCGKKTIRNIEYVLGLYGYTLRERYGNK